MTGSSIPAYSPVNPGDDRGSALLHRRIAKKINTNAGGDRSGRSPADTSPATTLRLREWPEERTRQPSRKKTGSTADISISDAYKIGPRTSIEASAIIRAVNFVTAVFCVPDGGVG